MPAFTECSFGITMPPKNLNILFLNSIEKTVWGGLENWMELCGVGLAKRGHRVRFAGREESQFLNRVAVHDNTEIIPLKHSGDFNPATIKRLAGYAGWHNINVMLCNFVRDVRLAGLARKLAGKYKIIWTPGVNLARKTLSHRYLFSNFVDRAIVPSKYLRDEIVVSGYIDKSLFDVIPIGIDDKIWHGNREEGESYLRRRFNMPDNAFVCLTSGRFVKQKGHCHLVEAARELAARYDNIFFLFLGDGPLKASLTKQINGYNLADRFIFGGMLEDHQRAVFGADLYVHPAIIEPFGIVLVEAMAAGLPVVATRVGGIPEVVAEDKTALLVDPADPRQLTNAIERFYNDSSLRERFGRAGHIRFEDNFRLKTMLDKLEASLIRITAG